MISGDTIAAIATAPGRGGIAVVRVSGSEAFGVAERLTGKGEEGRGIRVGRIANVDEGVILSFKAPHSYTGEDVVEFQCHGGTVTPRRVLEACLAAGARLARRGEFTQRAFLNGRLDYNQAESVLDLIDAKTVRAADAALEGLSGRRQREVRALYEQALDLSTRIEHALDVDEGELPADFLPSVSSSVSRLKSSLANAIRRSAEGRLLKSGALVVLAGPPNVGKSSLLNALLQEKRAIVSDIPGTTRDSIEAWLDLGGWPIRLVDTAGLRETKDEVEGEGVKRSEELLSKADVVIMLRSCEGEKVRRSHPLTLSPSHLPTLSPSHLPTLSPPHLPTLSPPHLPTLSPSHLLNITSKCDLGRGEGLNVSAKTGEGLDDLKRAIVAKLEEKVAASDEGDVPEGDVAAFHEALALLDGGHETGGVRCEEDLVLMANTVRAAAERLGMAIGATYSSDMLENLFSRFCVGK